MMMIRMMIRAPLMFIMATFMSISLNARLSIVILIAIPILGISLFVIAKMLIKV